MDRARPFRFVFAATLAGVVIGPAAARGQSPPPDYDFQWETIGAPGNRPADQQEAPLLYPPYTTPALPVGSVDHTYRISRDEVTVGQWFQFLNAYWPYIQGSPANFQLTGLWITPTNLTPGQNPDYVIAPGAANRPMQTTWRMAAIYTNWLSNGQGTTATAFASGAYDTSTFTVNPNGGLNDQRTHSPGAQFWIPTLDEWTKAMYYDPNKNGVGQEGYWQYPIRRDTPPVSGWPWEGGETSAGLPFNPDGPWLDVGSYPDVQSTWGLLDGSGSASEWTEYAAPDGSARIVKGSAQFFPSPELYDELEYVRLNGSPNNPSFGFRVASIVPAPPGLVIVLLFGIALLFTRRRGP